MKAEKAVWCHAVLQNRPRYWPEPAMSGEGQSDPVRKGENRARAWQQASAIRGFFAERVGVLPVGPLRAQFVVLFAARVAILFPPEGR